MWLGCTKNKLKKMPIELYLVLYRSSFLKRNSGVPFTGYLQYKSLRRHITRLPTIQMPCGGILRAAYVYKIRTGTDSYLVRPSTRTYRHDRPLETAVQQCRIWTGYVQKNTEPRYAVLALGSVLLRSISDHMSIRGYVGRSLHRRSKAKVE